MKTPYTYRAEKFIKVLFPYIQKALEKKERSTIDFLECVQHFNEEKKRKVVFDSGVSRMVFISSDYVVKVDLKEKNWAGTSENEYKMYLFAQEEGFEYLFAPSTRIEYHGYFFYVMPRVHNIDEWRDEDYFYNRLSDDEYDLISGFVKDIHGKNFGYLHQNLVLIDYACNDLSD